MFEKPIIDLKIDAIMNESPKWENINMNSIRTQQIQVPKGKLKTIHIECDKPAIAQLVVARGNAIYSSQVPINKRIKVMEKVAWFQIQINLI